mgnify:CR=1 FL=1
MPSSSAGLFLGIAPARAEPAVWLVTDRDSRMYLLGSLHLLGPDVPWRTPRLDALLDEAGEVWFEVAQVDGKPTPERIGLLQRFGLDRGQRLSSRLTPEEMRTLAAALQGQGLPAPALETLRPWLAAMMFAQAKLQTLGIVPDRGVERVLHAGARERGKAVRALETTEEAIRALATLPDGVQLDGLHQVLQDSERLGERFARLQAAWQQGDLPGVEREGSSAMALAQPVVHEALISTRNRAWLPKLVAELESDGVDLVVVGAAHLVGKDNLPELLRRRGYTVTRLGAPPTAAKPAKGGKARRTAAG